MKRLLQVLYLRVFVVQMLNMLISFIYVSLMTAFTRKCLCLRVLICAVSHLSAREQLYSCTILTPLRYEHLFSSALVTLCTGLEAAEMRLAGF